MRGTGYVFGWTIGEEGVGGGVSSIRMDVQASSLLCRYGVMEVGEFVGIVFLVAGRLGLFVGMGNEELGR